MVAALHSPVSKTGAKTVYLGNAAVELLEKAPVVVGSPWVITGALLGSRLNKLQHS